MRRARDVFDPSTEWARPQYGGELDRRRVQVKFKDAEKQLDKELRQRGSGTSRDPSSLPFG